MLFNSPEILVFLPIVFGFYWFVIQFSQSANPPSARYFYCTHNARCDSSARARLSQQRRDVGFAKVQRDLQGRHAVLVRSIGVSRTYWYGRGRVPRVGDLRREAHR